MVVFHSYISFVYQRVMDSDSTWSSDIKWPKLTSNSINFGLISRDVQGQIHPLFSACFSDFGWDVWVSIKIQRRKHEHISLNGQDIVFSSLFLGNMGWVIGFSRTSSLKSIFLSSVKSHQLGGFLKWRHPQFSSIWMGFSLINQAFRIALGKLR